MPPRRENQVLHAVVIVSVIAVVLMLIVTVVLWKQGDTLRDRVKSLTDENAKLAAGERGAIEDMQQMKTWLGHPPEAAIDEIDKAYQQEMATYAGSLPEGQRNYRELPRHLLQAIQERNKRIAELTARERELMSNIEKIQQEEQAKTAQAVKAQQAAEAELEKTRQLFAQERGRLNQEKTQFAQRADQLQQEKDQLTAATNKQIADLNQRIKNLESTIAIRDQTIAELTNQTFETPDGQIKSVNVRASTVVINLGRNDGLRPQVRFSVFGPEAKGLVDKKKKGEIEVINVGQTLSEARVVDQLRDDPILAGDVIYTPLWDARSAMRFALVGFMDINEDGQDDRELIKRLIALHGGKVDAEDTPTGVQGSMTIHTRYLVEGDEPLDSSDPAAEQARLARRQMINEASRFGVERMAVEELMSVVGYTGEKRVIPLGIDVRPEDFPAQPTPDSLRSAQFNDALFPLRRPPVRTENRRRP